MRSLLFIMVILLAPMTWAKSEFVAISTDELINNAAHVEAVHRIEDEYKDVKLFYVAGGDPSMNGAHLTLAVYNPSDMKWNVYPLKNVSDYSIHKSSKPGFLKISLVTEEYDVESGEIVSYNSVMFINLLNSDEPNGRIEIEEVR